MEHLAPEVTLPASFASTLFKRTGRDGLEDLGAALSLLLGLPTFTPTLKGDPAYQLAIEYVQRAQRTFQSLHEPNV